MTMTKRNISKSRSTAETKVTVDINLDGTGLAEIETGIGFLNHMLELTARHSFFDLKIKAEGDLDVDCHHTIEDIGIVLGDALAEALADNRGIARYGSASVPMDEALARVDIDICNRPVLVYNVRLGSPCIGIFDANLCEHFFQAFVSHARVTMHVNLEYGEDAHHCVEAVYKAFARALDAATRPDPRVDGVLSTKGML